VFGDEGRTATDAEGDPVPRWLRIALIVAASLLLLALVAPLLVPIPPLRDTVEPAELASPDSAFVEIRGLTVHYTATTASSSGPTFVLLHGFGASTFSWRDVIAPLAERGQVIAFDRPAFGLTERVLDGDWNPDEWPGGSPYTPEAQADLTIAVLDALEVDEAVLVGHSAGGTVAMLAALRHPTRVQALVLENAAIFTGGGAPRAVLPLLRTPQLRRVGPLLVRGFADDAFERLLVAAWRDPSRITDSIRTGYERPLNVADWDEALWELVIARGGDAVTERVGDVAVPTLVITGESDRVVPPADSARLAEEIPNAQLVSVPDAGHIPHEETPDAFVNALYRFVDSLELPSSPG
jgi:pimeloyl-ACP methyl ester carboxylesterase